jgi:Amt family ammonium transporter
MIARNYEDNMQAYNIPMVGLGVMTLWFGWLYFNAGSTLATSRPDSAAMAERAFMNTIIGPATAGITCFFTRKHIAGFHEMKGTKWDVVAMLNGVLCGLVAITGSCAVVDVWAAVIIGGVAPIFYALTLRIIDHWKIDDPSEAFPIHGPCGAWGIIAAAFFDKD